MLSTVPYATPTVTVEGVTFLAGQMVNAAPGMKSEPLVDGGPALTAPTGGEWIDKVVLVQRDGNPFINKVNNVQLVGGAAVVIYNNVPGGFTGTLGTNNTSTIPVICISMEDGKIIADKIVANNKLFPPQNTIATVNSPAAGTAGSSYAYYSGTSMAAPHVTGAAALYASTHPSASARQIRDALLSTAASTPSAAGKTITDGRLDLSTVISPSFPSAISAPTGVRALLTNSKVTLTWVGSPGAASYNVKRGTVSGTYITIKLQTTDTYCVDSSISSGTTYYYVISAVKGDGSETANSTEVSPLAAPAAPTAASATAKSQSQIDLKWTDSSNNENGFIIERSINNNKSFIGIATVGAGETSFTNLNLSRNTSYYYRVRAINAAGSSNYSNTANAKTLR